MVKVARDYERIEIGRVWQVDFAIIPVVPEPIGKKLVPALLTG